MILGVESIQDNRYQRTFRLDGSCQGWFEVTNCLERHALQLRIVTLSGPNPQKHIESRVRSMFDLDTNMTPILRVLGRDPLFSPVLVASSGLRLPGAWDPFEFTLRAILGQQISVKAATTLAGRVGWRRDIRTRMAQSSGGARSQRRPGGRERGWGRFRDPASRSVAFGRCSVRRRRYLHRGWSRRSVSWLCVLVSGRTGNRPISLRKRRLPGRDALGRVRLAGRSCFRLKKVKHVLFLVHDGPLFHSANP